MGPSIESKGKPPRWRGAPGALALLGALSTLVGVARAEGDAPGVQRVAVVRVEVEGSVPPAVQELFARRVAEGLTAVKLEVLAADHVFATLRRRDPALGRCKGGTCYVEIARALDVSYLVTAKVVESSKTYGVWLEMVNGRTGASMATSRERCETCGFEEAGEKVALAAGALRARLEGLAREPARVVIRSAPSGARVLVDGRSMGPTPLDLELAAGRHRVSLALEGHVALERTFTVVSGVDEQIDLPLVRIPSAFPYRAVGWASVATGALVMAGGIWLLQRDGAEVSCAAAAKDADNDCPKIWSTKAGGATLLGLGAAAASLGGVFVYVGRGAGGGGASNGERAALRIGYRARF